MVVPENVIKNQVNSILVIRLNLARLDLAKFTTYLLKDIYSCFIGSYQKEKE